MSATAGWVHLLAMTNQPTDATSPLGDRRASGHLPDVDRQRIREAARAAAEKFPPMTSDLVAAVRRALRNRTAA